MNKSKYPWKLGDIAVIKDGWYGANNHLVVLGPALFHEQWWVPILGLDDDPAFYKEDGIDPLTAARSD